MDYEVSISIKAIEFILFTLEKEGTRLLFEFQRLGRDPHREPDFSDKGEEGELNGILIDEYAILYYVDHAAKRINVVDVTYADQI